MRGGSDEDEARTGGKQVPVGQHGGKRVQNRGKQVQEDQHGGKRVQNRGKYKYKWVKGPGRGKPRPYNGKERIYFVYTVFGWAKYVLYVKNMRQIAINMIANFLLSLLM